MSTCTTPGCIKYSPRLDTFLRCSVECSLIGWVHRYWSQLLRHLDFCLLRSTLISQSHTQTHTYTLLLSVLFLHQLTSSWSNQNSAQKLFRIQVKIQWTWSTELSLVTDLPLYLELIKSCAVKFSFHWIWWERMGSVSINDSWDLI